MTEPVPAYAVAYLREVDFGDDIIRYMREIDATMAPFGGEFIVHGGELVPVEGEWDGALVVIRFPNLDAATRWYASPDYRRIAPLRVDNSSSIAALVEGVGAGHTGAKRVAELLATRSALPSAPGSR